MYSDLVFIEIELYSFIIHTVNSKNLFSYVGSRYTYALNQKCLYIAPAQEKKITWLSLSKASKLPSKQEVAQSQHKFPAIWERWNVSINLPIKDTHSSDSDDNGIVSCTLNESTNPEGKNDDTKLDLQTNI